MTRTIQTLLTFPLAALMACAEAPLDLTLGPNGADVMGVTLAVLLISTASAMIVAGPEGFVKAAYRKFRIKGAQARNARDANDRGAAGEPSGGG